MELVWLELVGPDMPGPVQGARASPGCLGPVWACWGLHVGVLRLNLGVPGCHLGVSGRSGVGFDASGVDFGGRNVSFFEALRHVHAVIAYFVRMQQNTVKTDTGSTSELPHDKPKTLKNRSAGACDSVGCAEHAWTALRGSLGASRGRPGDTFGRLLAALGSPGRSKIGSGTAFGRPGAAPRAPQRAS